MSDGHARLPSSQAFDHLVYVRVFEGCNLHCKHCFIPSNPRRMTIENIEAIPSILEKRIPQGSHVLLQWHGGEPTLMGAKFMRDAIERIEAKPHGLSFRHGIQTNLMTYDETWARLYHEKFAGEVGISWDAGIRLINRRSPNSFDTFNKKFEDRLAALLADGLTPYLVVTATKRLFQDFPNPYDFFNKWLALGVHHVHLERITETGFARENWGEVGLSNAEYSSHMSRWMRAYSRMKSLKPDCGFYLSPFDNLIESARSLHAGEPQAAGCWSGACDTRFHTIDGDGYKMGCTALTSEIGNRNATTAPIIRNDISKSRELRTYDCHACEFRSICSSGCLALSFDDGSGECSGGYSFLAQASKLATREASQ